MKQKIMDISTERGFTEAVKWIKGQLGLLCDDGVWMIPRSMSAVRVVSHSKLEAQMIGMKREPGVVGIMRSLGWKITETQP